MGNNTVISCLVPVLLLATLTVRDASSVASNGDYDDWSDDVSGLPRVPNVITKFMQNSGTPQAIEGVQAETLSNALVKSIMEELTASKRRPTLRGIYCGNGTVVVQPYLIDEIILYQKRARQFTKGFLDTYATHHSFMSWDVLSKRYRQGSDVALVPLLPELPTGEPSYYRIEVEKESIPHPHQTKHKMHIDKGLVQEKARAGTHKSPDLTEPQLFKGSHEEKEEEGQTFLSLDPPLGIILQSHLQTVQLHLAAVEHVMLDHVLDWSSSSGVLKGFHRLLSGLARLSDQLLRTLRECRVEPEMSHLEKALGNPYQRVDVDGALTRGVRTLRQTLKGLDFFKSCLVPIIK